MSDRLPLLCRLRRHGWRPAPLWHPNHVAAWQRETCRRCEHLDPPTP